MSNSEFNKGFNKGFKEQLVNIMMVHFKYESDAVKAYLLRGLNPCRTCQDILVMWPPEIHKHIPEYYRSHAQSYPRTTIKDYIIEEYKEDCGRQVLSESMMMSVLGS